MRRLATVLATTALLGAGLVAAAGAASAEDLRDECYDHLGCRSIIACFKIPPGVPSPVDLP